MARAFAVHEFESKLNRALERVRVVLHDAKGRMRLASEVHHTYDDKYALVEHVTNVAVASQVNCLATLGLDKDKFAVLQTWAASSIVSLRFKAEERCTFLREESREEDSPTRSVEEFSVGGRTTVSVTSKVVNKITEYFWKFDVCYELTAIRGVGAESADCLKILSHSSAEELKTRSKTPPHPDVSTPSIWEVDISWLLHHLPSAPENTMTPKFGIERSSDRCKTPRRNPEVDSASKHFVSVSTWANCVGKYLEKMLTTKTVNEKRLDMNALLPSSALVPVLPILADGASGNESRQSEDELGIVSRISDPIQGSQGNIQCSTWEVNTLLGEEMRKLAEMRANICKIFVDDSAIASSNEAFLCTVLIHCVNVCDQWLGSVDYVESLLRKQLIAAIGKDVTPADFSSYMKFHNRRLFKERYVPAPFCFAVRRSVQHSPEGMVSIEEDVVGSGGDSNISTPILTLVAKCASPETMTFPLSSSTTVLFDGERYLHAWLSHQFSGQSGTQLSLVSRARQFSSMLVLVGRIVSASSFEPTYAAIIQNKDELKIPLDLSTIPTPQEFKDAIESLSPEQQSFAKALRAMQLESTLFGVLIVQIKPQLEKVLNLAEDSLTKEIKLTQDLMQLFIKYQIPSDLLSFDEASGQDGTQLVEPSNSERLAAVREHVKAMNEMIQLEKNEELEHRRREDEYANPRARSDPFRGSWHAQQDLLSDQFAMENCIAMSAAMPSPPPPPCPSSSLSAGKGPPMAKAKAASSSKGGKSAHASAPKGKVGSTSAHVASASNPAFSSQAPQPQENPHYDSSTGSAAGSRDYTQVPRQMDEQFEKLDSDSALRPTIITPSDSWVKKSHKSLLAGATTTSLAKEEQKAEKEAAFDLLDALTKSGALPLTHASLHIVVAATHCFDKSVTETIIQDNANPIEKVERSTLIMASTIHQQPAEALVGANQCNRLRAISPKLFIDDGFQSPAL